MRKTIIYPLLALVLGGLGAALRMWHLYSYVNDGLPPNLHPASALLMVLCAVVLAAFAALALREKGTCAGALFAGKAPVRAALLVGTTLLLLLSAVMNLSAVMAAQVPLSKLLELILGVLALPAAVSTAFLAKDAWTGGGRSMDSFTAILPALFCWVWLIEVYRHNTSDPILWDYVFLLLAAVCLLLAAHGRAGFSFGEGKPRLTVFAAMAGLFFAPIALADFRIDLMAALILVAYMLYAVANLSALVRNEAMPAQVQADDLENQTEVSSDE